MFDVARAATADAVLKKFDGWLARQRQFSVEDPSMPRWARSALPPAFDAVAAEVRRVVESCVEEELRLRARRTSAAEARAAPAARGWLASFRRGLLYALQPYDRTSWRRNADPRYWAIKACCACPYFGIQTLSFAVARETTGGMDPSSKNFTLLHLGLIRVASADFWTDRFPSARSLQTLKTACRARANTC
jgi:hypothetical protein